MRDVAVVTAGVGVVGSAGVLLATIIGGHAISGLGWLLYLAVPAVFLGHGRVAALYFSRMPAASAGKGAFFLPMPFREYRRRLFGDLDPRIATALLGVAAAGWVLAMASMPTALRGTPTNPEAGCPYRIESHGSSACVTQAAYAAAGVAEQRVLSGLILAFFCVQLGSAWVREENQDAQGPMPRA